MPATAPVRLAMEPTVSPCDSSASRACTSPTRTSLRRPSIATTCTAIGPDAVCSKYSAYVTPGATGSIVGACEEMGGNGGAGDNNGGTSAHDARSGAMANVANAKQAARNGTF